MKIEFLEKNFRITSQLKEIIEKKVVKFDKYFGEDMNVKVFCKKENKLQKLEITILHKGLLYRSETSGEDMFANIDIALPKLERQILKQIDRRKDKIKSGTPESSKLLFLTETEYKKDKKEKAKKVLKTKQFKLEPIAIETAQEAMEALGHDFYVFLNQQTGKVNVLYLRNDGEYGLIECEQ